MDFVIVWNACCFVKIACIVAVLVDTITQTRAYGLAFVGN